MNINKAIVWAAMLAMATCTFTACNGNGNESNTNQEVDSTSTELVTEEPTTEPQDDTGIFVDFNEDDYSVDMTFDEIYKKNEISAEPIDDVVIEDSGLYYELNLKITSENIESLQDSTGVYVAELDLSTSELTDCGDAVGEDEDGSKPVVIMFGDKNLLNTDYLNQAFNVDNETRTMFVKGEFRGMIALYPMLVESNDNKVYIFKPFLEMSKTKDMVINYYAYIK